MPFPLASPEDLTRRAEQELEAAIRLIRPDANAASLARAIRSPRGVLAALVRTQALGLYEVHQHIRWWGDQLFPDTAEAEILERHASIWGVTRRPATRAVGSAVFAGLAGVIIPAGTQMVNASGALIETSAASAAIGVGGTVTVAVRAVEGSASGNAAGGSTLSLVTPVAGLNPQSATLSVGGLQGGADVEDDAALLVRLLAEIREPGAGGNQYDYAKWVFNSFAAAKVRTLSMPTGPGSVAVVVAMGTKEAPRAPTTPELTAIADELNMRRPVGFADFSVIAATITPTALTIGVQPDTAQVRAAVTAAYAAFMAQEAEIGGTIFRSRLVEALSSAAGEFRHSITVPTGDISSSTAELRVPGTITWVVL